MQFYKPLWLVLKTPFSFFLNSSLILSQLRRISSIATFYVIGRFWHFFKTAQSKQSFFSQVQKTVLEKDPFFILGVVSLLFWTIILVRRIQKGQAQKRLPETQPKTLPENGVSADEQNLEKTFETKKINGVSYMLFRNGRRHYFDSAPIIKPTN